MCVHVCVRVHVCVCVCVCVCVSVCVGMKCEMRRGTYCMSSNGEPTDVCSRTHTHTHTHFPSLVHEQVLLFAVTKIQSW